MPIIVLKTAWKLDNKYMRYSNIGSTITNMLEIYIAEHLRQFSCIAGAFGTPHRRCAASQRVAGPLDPGQAFPGALLKGR